MSQTNGIATSSKVDYLARYASDYHRWRTVKEKEKAYHVRPLGLVETAFDYDALANEGRADTSALLTLEVESTLSEDDFRHKVILTWACIRAHHGLLRAKAVNGDALPAGLKLDQHERHFVVSQLESSIAAMNEASAHTVFVKGHYSDVDPELFYRHVMNTSRTVDPSICLSKLFVLPPTPFPNNISRVRLNFLFVVAHEITDGLSIYAQSSHFLRLFNTPTSTLLSSLVDAIKDPSHLPSSLPAAQESLYPPLHASPARRRWRWAISRILRHTRRPPPPSFPNPLRRTQPLPEALHMPKLFDKVLDYSTTPPLNSYTSHVTLPPATSAYITRLCRELGVSIGAGCFALVGMAMMIMHERTGCAGCAHRSNDSTHTIIPGHHLPFVTSFPINPRPFFAKPATVPTSSLMLSFSDGLALPFLPSDPSHPSHLPSHSRFRLLARQAHRQLSVYQKRARTATEWEAVGLWRGLGSRSPRELLPGGYLSMVERVEGLVGGAGGRRDGEGKDGEGMGVQGKYPVRRAKTGATCGVSSIGDRRGWFPAVPDPHHHGTAMTAPTSSNHAHFTFLDLHANVRVRDGEFLVGSSGDDQGLHFSASYDGCAISEEKAGEWEGVMLGLFDEVEVSDGEDVVKVRDEEEALGIVMGKRMGEKEGRGGSKL